MSGFKKKSKKGKSGPSKEPHPELKRVLLENAVENKLPCAAAFKISQDRSVSMHEIGIAADFLEIRLTKCQLGLFGYKPEKKIAKPVAALGKNLEEKVKSASHDGKISCKAAWQIASDLDISRLEVGNACETMSVKIGPCQLGAF